MQLVEAQIIHHQCRQLQVTLVLVGMIMRHTTTMAACKQLNSHRHHQIAKTILALIGKTLK